MSNIDRWPTGALLDLLIADGAVNAMIAGRAYGQELPKRDVPSMPRKCVVLASNGGPGQDDDLPIGTVRVDALSYGETFGEAQELWFQVQRVLRSITPQNVGDVRINAVRLEVGPRRLVDPDGRWPVFFDSWLVTSARVAV